MSIQIQTEDSGGKFSFNSFHAVMILWASSSVLFSKLKIDVFCLVIILDVSAQAGQLERHIL